MGAITMTAKEIKVKEIVISGRLLIMWIYSRNKESHSKHFALRTSPLYSNNTDRLRKRGGI